LKHKKHPTKTALPNVKFHKYSQVFTLQSSYLALVITEITKTII